MTSRAVEFTDSWVLVADDPVDDVDVDVLLRYEDSEPFEVCLMYDTEDGQCQVMAAQFSRDLLAKGLGLHAGDGNVQVWPDTDPYRLWVVLADPTAQWCFVAPRQHIQDFVTETFRLVPRGKESWFLSVPDDVAELLEGGDDEWARSAS